MSRVEIALTDVEIGRITAYLEIVQEAQLGVRQAQAILASAQQTFREKSTEIARTKGLEGVFHIDTQRWVLFCEDSNPSTPKSE